MQKQKNNITADNFKNNDNKVINNENRNNKIEIKEKINKNKIKIKNIPKVKIKEYINFPTSIYSYFLISFGLFVLSCNCAWNEYGTTTLPSTFLFIGLFQYILGIYDFYQGNNFLFIQNIIFGIRYINFFLNYFEINGLKRTKNIFSSIQGVIDFIMFSFLTIFSMIIKGKSIIYFIDYFTLLISNAFFVLSGYAEDYKIIIKITGYLLFFNSIIFWLTGMCLVINDISQKKYIKFVEPRIQ